MTDLIVSEYWEVTDLSKLRDKLALRDRVNKTATVESNWNLNRSVEMSGGSRKGRANMIILDLDPKP